MKANEKRLLSAALALPERVRVRFAQKLLESLPLTTDGMDDDELEAELDRRRREYERDPSVAQPWSKVKHMR